MTEKSAFYEYREETPRHLENEQDEFEAFLKRLRKVKDKAQFDEFMDELRRGGPRSQGGVPSSA